MIRSIVRGSDDATTIKLTIDAERAISWVEELLACFANAQLRQTVTLAQVLFFGKDNDLRKLHIVAPHQLTIHEHFQFADADQTRKQLRVLGADVYDEFAKYSRDFLKRFGLRSDKALDLFNQTVSIKEIGGLNSFVRQHMLERTVVHARIDQLREHYKNLTSAHDAITKAEQQLARLRPLLAEASCTRAGASTCAGGRTVRRAGAALLCLTPASLAELCAG